MAFELPRQDNKFLNDNKASQFAKSNTDGLGKMFGGVMAGTTKQLFALNKQTTEEIKVSSENADTNKSSNKELQNQTELLQQNQNLFKDYLKTMNATKTIMSNVASLAVENKTKNFANASAVIKESKSTKSTTRETAKNVATTKSLFSTDYEKKDSKNIGDIENQLISLNEKYDGFKQGVQKKGMGFLMGFGKLLAAGGLLGYFMTGKKEFLFSTIKGFRWMGKAIFPTIKTGFKTAMKGFTFGKDVFKGLKAGKGLKSAVSLGLKNAFKGADVAKNVTKGLKGVKGINGMMKSLDIVKDIGKFFSKIGKVTAGIARVFKALKGGGLKGGGKALTRMFGKTAGKGMMTKIPGVGALLGVVFGISRFKKGDWLGGILEIASGVAGIVPGIGTAISLGIDGILLFKDFMGGKKKKSPGGSGKSANGGFSIPSMPSGLETPESGGDVYTDTPSGALAFGTKSLKSYKYLDAKSSASKQPQGKDVGFKKGNIVSRTIGKAVGWLSKKLFGDKKGVSLYEPWSPDVAGLNPDMRKNFFGMAEDYYNMTNGGSIQVNSAKRNGFGRSSHNSGFAMDINSGDADTLESAGLLQKWGFHRPLLSWGDDSPGNPKAKNEAWHIEPYPGQSIYGARNTINNKYRIPTLMGGANPNNTKPEQGGDVINTKGGNLPNESLQQTYSSKNPMHVVLSNADIEKLAIAMGQSFKSVLPNGKQMKSSGPATTARSN